MIFAGTSPPSGVTAVQDGPTSIRVSWTPSSDATGYMIYYDNNRDHSGNEAVSNGSTETHTLTGLVIGDTYTISIVATSHHFPSERVAIIITLGRTLALILIWCVPLKLDCNVTHSFCLLSTS